MALEPNVKLISDLVSSNPSDTDLVQQGAAHIRNIKTALQGSFPNIKGAVSASETDLNNLKSLLGTDGKSLTVDKLTGDSVAATSVTTDTLTANKQVSTSSVTTDTLTANKQALVPSVVDWTTQQAVSAKDADTRYAKITDPLVRSLIVPEADYLIDKIAAHKSNGRLWFHYTDKDGKEQYPEAALASDLDAKQAAGNYAKTDSQNTFLGVQNFNEAIILADGIILQTIGGTGGVAVNRYTDGNGLATTDLNNAATGANISWFRLYQDGMLRTNKGDVAFTSELPFVDQNLRVQVWEATAAGDGALQALPQAFRVLVAVQATQQGNYGNSFGNNMVEIIDGGHFRLHNAGNANSYCTAYGYF